MHLNPSIPPTNPSLNDPPPITRLWPDIGYVVEARRVDDVWEVKGWPWLDGKAKGLTPIFVGAFWEDGEQLWPKVLHLEFQDREELDDFQEAMRRCCDLAEELFQEEAEDRLSRN